MKAFFSAGNWWTRYRLKKGKGNNKYVMRAGSRKGFF